MIEFALNQINQAAQQVITTNKGLKLWAFYGQMGAGKTALIKAICKQLGVLDEVSSPTFSLVNEYKTNDNQTIYHFDFYRIKNLEEVYDIGYEDYFYSGNLCLIEWPELVEDILRDEEVRRINISINSTNQNRLISL